MKTGQHLHNAIGNVIGEEKRELFDLLNQDANLERAVERFIGRLSLRLEQIAEVTTVQRQLEPGLSPGSRRVDAV